jgi:hypothetical protein
LFSIASCNDDGDTHINYVEDLIVCNHQENPKKVKGSVIIKKAQLETILNQEKNDKKTPPQPPSPEMNAETIIKFLKTKGYVNPHFKLMLHYVCRGITESSQRRDFENWVKNNGNSLVPELSQNQIDSLKDNRFDEMFRQIRK